MSKEDRGAQQEALERARLAAYSDGEYIGQESFMSASEIRLVAERAGVSAGTSVLDVCCGAAGPGRLITAELGCDYCGVDASPRAIELARDRFDDLPSRFEVAQVPPLPIGTFDVVLLLETILAFPDKDTLLRGIASALRPGGRFGFTVEEGVPLTTQEQAVMPHADTVWLIPLPQLMSSLEAAGLVVRWSIECTLAHRARAQALAQAFLADRSAIRKELGTRALDDLVTAHLLWAEWLGSGRVRKFALVAERSAETACE